MKKQPLRAPSQASTSEMASLPQTLIDIQAGMAVRVIITMLINASILASILALFLPQHLPVFWLCVVVVALAVRTAILVKLPAMRLSDQGKLRMLVLAFAISGAAQGGLSFFLPHIPPIAAALVIIYVCGMCAATVPDTNGYFPAYTTYLLVCLLPNCLSMIFFTEYGAQKEYLLALAISFPVLAIILSAQARSAFRVFKESYSIRLERMQMNMELSEALQTAELANAAKTRFLASASHDLRQPIHALSLFSAALAMRELEPQAKRIAEQMEASINTISSQLDVLLDISKLDAGVVEVDAVNVDVAALLKNLGDEFRHLAERKGLVLIIECDVADAYVDRMLLERALRNLIANAIKYTKRGHVTVSARTEGESVIVEVLDSGQGISDEEQQYIFDEFYQVDNPERDRTKGLGLGLSIVRRVVELLDATVDVKSTLGVGSCFRLVLPIGERASLSAKADAVVKMVGESSATQLLVLDDEQSVCEGMKTLLESVGYEVVAVCETADAIAALAEFEPDVVLIDFRLRGGEKGTDVVQRLREVLPALPAIVISGDTGPDTEAAAAEVKAKLIRKPASLESLQKALYEVLPDHA